MVRIVHIYILAQQSGGKNLKKIHKLDLGDDDDRLDLSIFVKKECLGIGGVHGTRSNL